MDQKPTTRYIPAAVVLCLGLLLTCLLCVLWQRHYHQARVQAEFERRAIILSDVLQSELTHLLEALESIGSLYAASTEVERGECERRTRHTVQQHPAIQGLDWIPRALTRCARRSKRLHRQRVSSTSSLPSAPLLTSESTGSFPLRSVHFYEEMLQYLR